MSTSHGWLRRSNQRSQIAELAHSVRPARVGSPRPSWMCPKTASGGCTRSIAASSAVEPTRSPIGREVAVPARRRVRHEHVDAVGDRREALGELVLPGRHEHAAAPARRPVRHDALPAAAAARAAAARRPSASRARRGHQGDPYTRTPATVASASRGTSTAASRRPGDPTTARSRGCRRCRRRARRPRRRCARARARTRPRATAPGCGACFHAYGLRSPAITTRSHGGTTTPSSRPCRSASAATRTA